MARGINKVMLIGNLGRDPETRYAQNGSAVTRFSIATSESWKDRTSGEQQERTEWHNVVCFARLAEIAGEYLRKGSKVYIEGSLRTSSWEANGEKSIGPKSTLGNCKCWTVEAAWATAALAAAQHRMTALPVRPVALVPRKMLAPLGAQQRRRAQVCRTMTLRTISRSRY